MAVSSFLSTLFKKERVAGSPAIEAWGCGPGALPPLTPRLLPEPDGFLPAFLRLFPGIVRNSFSRRSAHTHRRHIPRHRKSRRRCAVRSAYCRRRQSSNWHSEREQVSAADHIVLVANDCQYRSQNRLNGNQYIVLYTFFGSSGLQTS